MTFKLELGELAIADLQEIDSSIAGAAGGAVADGYLARIRAAADALLEFPARGTPRDELGHGVRSIVFERRFIFFYRVVDDMVVLLRVSHGARQVDALDFGD